MSLQRRSGSSPNLPTYRAFHPRRLQAVIAVAACPPGSASRALDGGLATRFGGGWATTAKQVGRVQAKTDGIKRTGLFGAGSGEPESARP